VSAPALTVTLPPGQTTSTADSSAVARVRQVWRAREVDGGQRLVAAEVARELGVSDTMVKLALRALRGPREQATGPATAYDRIEHLYRTRERAGGQHLKAEQVGAEVGTNPRYVASTLYVLRALDRDGPPPPAQWTANRQRAAESVDQLARQRRQADRGMDGDWRAKAVCAAPSVDPELFFPEAGEGWKVVKAKQVCSGCSVRASCLHEALTGPQAQGEDVYGIFGGTSQAERRHLRGRQSLATPTVFYRDREQAGNALTLARQVGIVQAARQLGVSVQGLYSAWDHHQLGRPHGHRGSPPSVFLTDRTAAERAFQRARQVGITAAAKEAGVNHQALRKAWQRHGVGLPERLPQDRQPAARPLTRAFLGLPGNEAFARPVGASPARLAARARRLEELEALGPRVAYDLAAENRPRRSQSRAWVVTTRAQRARDLAADRAAARPADRREQVRRRLLAGYQRRQAARAQRAAAARPTRTRTRPNPTDQERER
jgi:Transcription factor WhiB